MVKEAKASDMCHQSREAIWSCIKDTHHRMKKFNGVVFNQERGNFTGRHSMTTVRTTGPYVGITVNRNRGVRVLVKGKENPRKPVKLQMKRAHVEAQCFKHSPALLASAKIFLSKVSKMKTLPPTETQA